MKVRLLGLACSLAALAALAGAASSYSVKFYDSVKIGTTELKPGDYKIEMQGDKAVFKKGKSVVEVPATVAQTAFGPMVIAACEQYLPER